MDFVLVANAQLKLLEEHKIAKAIFLLKYELMILALD